MSDLRPDKSAPAQTNDHGVAAALRRWLLSFNAQDIAPVVSLIVLLGFFGLAARGFVSLGTLQQVLNQGSVLALVAVGLTFVLLCGEIDLSVGTVATFTACMCGWLFLKTAPAEWLPTAAITLVSLMVPLLAALVFGVLSGLLTVGSRLPSFIITLAMMNVAQGVAKYMTGGTQMTALPPLLDALGQDGLQFERLFFVTLKHSFTLPYSAFLAAGALLVGHVVLQHTRFGRYVYMTGGNREAARLAGVRTGLIVGSSLAISAVCAGLGGLVAAGRPSSVSASDNPTMLLDAVACVVLGGTSLAGGEGSMRRTLLGVITYTVLDVGLNKIVWINEYARPLLMGVVLLAALVVNGLLARKR